MSEEEPDENEPEAEEEQAESAEIEEPDTGDEAAEATNESDDQPDIDDDERAVIPDGIDADEIEDDTAPDEDEETEEQSTDEEAESDSESDTDEEGDESLGMGPDGQQSPIKAGEIYVTVVQQATNAAIRARGDEESEEVDREHFEEYQLAHYFDLTMEEMGVGSDLDPHEALLLSTALAVGEPIFEQTDVMDRQIGQLMDRAMSGGDAA